MYYVTSNDIVYNYFSYAVIDSISPQQGSVNGGTLITITGKYLKNSYSTPVYIDISGSPCKVISFDNVNPINSILRCETIQPTVNSIPMYYGGRGVALYKENTFTSLSINLLYIQ